MERLHTAVQDYVSRKFRCSRDVVTRLDVDGDGLVSQADLTAGFKDLSIPFDDVACAKLFKGLDTRNTGKLPAQVLVRAVRGVPTLPPTCPPLGIADKTVGCEAWRA